MCTCSTSSSALNRDYRTLIISALSIALLTCAWISLIVVSAAPRVASSRRIQDRAWQQQEIVNPEGKGDNRESSGSSSSSRKSLSIQQIVFGIAGSTRLWPTRKELVRLWWRPGQMRGFVWHEDPVKSGSIDPALPAIRISEDTSSFRYTNVNGHPAGIRIARIVLETVRLNLSGVEWIVLCDDDTVFSVDNLLHVLDKYDSSLMYYIGGISESHKQNVEFSHKMAYGGGGIALSYALAKALASVLDQCLIRYPQLTGSDDRLSACISELGVPLTKEPGFHQMDIRGDPLGILSAHPIAPFISIHHIGNMDPLFPNQTRLQSLQHLMKAMEADSSNFLQQTIGYHRSLGLTFSISTGYVVQVFEGAVPPRDLEKVEITFNDWNTKSVPADFDMDARMKAAFAPPFLYFQNSTYQQEKNNNSTWVVNEYTLHVPDARHCQHHCWPSDGGRYFGFKVPDFEIIRVFSRPLSNSWYKVPRRQCCRFGGLTNSVLEVTISGCEAQER